MFARRFDDCRDGCLHELVAAEARADDDGVEVREHSDDWGGDGGGFGGDLRVGDFGCFAHYGVDH